MLINVIFSFLATFFFGFLINVKKDKLVYAAINGGISSFVYQSLLLAGVDAYICTFIAALIFASYSEIMAYLLKTTTTTFALSGLLPVAPGASMYYAMLAFVNNDGPETMKQSVSALLSALLLALGLMIVASISRSLKLAKRKTKKINS